MAYHHPKCAIYVAFMLFTTRTAQFSPQCLLEAIITDGIALAISWDV